MDISELGEFGLIKRITENISLENSSTLKGVGDDCAVMQYPQDNVTLASSDILMEGIHFDLTYCPLKTLGYKAAMVNFSDIYAMNGMPEQLIVNIAVDKRFSVEQIDEIYEGLKWARQNHHVDLVGGDTSSSLTGLVISPTCIGSAPKSQVVYRNGAENTNLICVSGNLGAAYMGLQLLEREKQVYRQQNAEHPESPIDFQPDFSGKEYILERQLKPEARRIVVETLRNAGILPTSMIDVSDGLSSELLHICQQSNTGCLIYEERIPIDYQTAMMAEQFNLNVITSALNGGEDYELLFTVKLSDYDKVKTLEGIRIIGHITPPQQGCMLQTRDGNTFELKAQGWNPLQD